MTELPFRKNHKEFYSIFAEEPVMKTIIYKFGLIRVNAELSNTLHLFDINIFAENFFNNLFSIVRNTTYENLNLSKQNEKAVDIVDNTNKIAIQITSENTSNKIKKTIKKFSEIKSELKDYELQIFIISEKKRKNHDNVFYIEDLIKEIYKLPYSQKNKINEFLNESINLSISDAIVDKTDFNNPIRPKNLKRFYKTFNNNCTEHEDEYNLLVINKYIDKLCFVDNKSRKYFNKFAKIMYKLKDNKNIVKSYPNFKKYIKLSVIEHNLNFSTEKDLLEIVQYLEDMDLITFDKDWETGRNKIITFNGMCDWTDLVYELMDFTNKNNINSEEFFVNLNFSSLEEIIDTEGEKI